ncbi:hypothetical protein G647_02912 [Cladophialophora carrionii CBS 160.54]|uniref:N-acetyltransferase domain-containing protein n=1 Tax=Cladophialophora carrionii CBS 160.54 TaxID=1279043 RepID=V9DH05_9EURO|nr:uncharacterized protein G647_02912 [Cladophialophora carrionii CBS 160.54]ETI26135.1 hypothetical protein G647_02912 [Cladophialophora carrionii CBS 160.54]
MESNTEPQPAFPPLETDRLILRMFDPSRPADYAAILAIYDGPYAHRTVGNLGLSTAEDVDNRCRKFGPRPQQPQPQSPSSSSTSGSVTPTTFPTHPWHLIYLRAQPDRGVIGMTSLFHRRPLPSPDLVYYIHEEYTGRGYATEAGTAALRWWTDAMGVQDIWAGIFDTNHASQRVARKIGLVVDGGVVRLVDANGVVREARAFVQPASVERKGRWLDGVVVDVREKRD